MYFETPEVVQKQETLKIDCEVVYQNNILEYKLLLNNLKKWSNNDTLCEEKDICWAWFKSHVMTGRNTLSIQ